jgi:hypothetical protein
MYAPVHGQYTIFHGNLDEINFSNGWAYFCHMNKIVVGSALACLWQRFTEYPSKQLQTRLLLSMVS